MGYNLTIEEIQRKSKQFVDANVWDGEDRSEAVNDRAIFSPVELEALIDDLLLYLSGESYI